MKLHIPAVLNAVFLAWILAHPTDRGFWERFVALGLSLLIYYAYGYSHAFDDAREEAT